ncbi:MAG: hypothetical protein ABDH37_02875 [Candidatus Hydrothermales bacterium]
MKRLFLIFPFIFLYCKKREAAYFKLPGNFYLSNYSTMQLAGNFQGWNLSDVNSYMELVDDFKWEIVKKFKYKKNIMFKFVPNQKWDPSFGTSWEDTSLYGRVELVSGEGTHISASLPIEGYYKFTLIEDSLYYRITKLSGTGTIKGKVEFEDIKGAPYPISKVYLYYKGSDTLLRVFTTTQNDNSFEFQDLVEDSFTLISSSQNYYSDTTFLFLNFGSIKSVNFNLRKSFERVPIIIDGENDFLPTDLVGVDPTSDISEPNLDLDSLWAVHINDKWYVGFNVKSGPNYGLAFGIYIFTNSISPSGASRDPWNRKVAVGDSLNPFYPKYILYVWHPESDILEKAQLCVWSGTSWIYKVLEDKGGEQGYRSRKFLEFSIPDSLLSNPDSIFIEVFTTGGENTHAQDTSPLDPNVNFSSPDWTIKFTYLSRFVKVIKRF